MPAGLHLQPRDIAILAELGEFGLLDTDTIHERHFPDVSRRRVQQRLQIVPGAWPHEDCSLSVWFNTDQRRGRVPTIHYLTERGAEAVQEVTGQRPLRVLRGEPKPETLHHRLAVVKSRLAIDDACSAAKLSGTRVDHGAGPRPDRHGPAALATAIPVPCFRRRAEDDYLSARRGLCPSHPPKPAATQANTSELLVYWEIDRSTESRAQILEKIPGYTLLLDRKPYRRYWPQLVNPTVRVFWVCQSDERIAALCEKLRDVPVARCFRFTTVAELTPELALCAPMWQLVDRSRREIMRLPAAAPRKGHCIMTASRATAVHDTAVIADARRRAFLPQLGLQRASAPRESCRRWTTGSTSPSVGRQTRNC